MRSSKGTACQIMRYFKLNFMLNGLMYVNVCDRDLPCLIGFFSCIKYIVFLRAVLICEHEGLSLLQLKGVQRGALCHAEIGYVYIGACVSLTIGK